METVEVKPTMASWRSQTSDPTASTLHLHRKPGARGSALEAGWSEVNAVAMAGGMPGKGARNAAEQRSPTTYVFLKVGHQRLDALALRGRRHEHTAGGEREQAESKTRERVRQRWRERCTRRVTSSYWRLHNGELLGNVHQTRRIHLRYTGIQAIHPHPQAAQVKPAVHATGFLNHGGGQGRPR